jgi:general secretion pathway protein G
MKTQYKVNKKMKKAFSLMELMVVIIILGLLASFVLPSLTGKSEDAKEKLVCVQMKSISQALKMYKIDYSAYPTTEDQEAWKNFETNYFEDGKMPKDSWGGDYIYISDGETFDIISFGANKKEGGEDDISLSKDCSQK